MRRHDRETRRLLGRLWGLWVPAGDPPELRNRKALLVAVSLMVIPAGLLWGGLLWALDEPAAALVPWAYTAASVAALAAHARLRSFRLLRAVELTLILVLPAVLLVVLGGIVASGGVVLWSLLAPLGAIAFDGPRAATRWFAAFLVLVAGSTAVAPFVRPDGAGLPEGALIVLGALNVVGVSLVAFVLLSLFARQRAEALARAETLLLNVLPDEIARRLQHEEGAIADHFEETSILFADVVDFSVVSGRLQPAELVEALDRLFTSFDELVDRHRVEKIKTIGDCYMVAAGVPARRPDHAHALARMALEMREAAAGCLPDGGLELRIGISSGPVVAGVIGRRRFLYDLWGDTVNMASRMESLGAPGTIQITRSTWELVREDFDCRPRGLVDVKGKGPVETWELVSARALAAATRP